MPKYIAVIGSIILLGAFLLPLAGQMPESLTVEDGLSQGFVSSMLQTRNGFLWAATLDGLNRYDGVGFKTYHHDPLDPRSLNSNFVLYLYEDSQRRLWVVTDKGLNCMDQQTEKFYALPAEKQPRTKSGHSMRAFTEDCRGEFWGILDDSVYHFELPEHAEGFARQIDGMKVSSIYVPVKSPGWLQNIFTTDSAVWVGAENGIWTVSYREGKVAPAPFPVPANMAGLWRDGVTGDIWVYGGRSLHRRTGHRWEEFDLGDDKVTHIRTGLQGSQGVYFFSLHHVFLWKDGVLTKLAGEVPEEIMSACLDREGILWVGTNAGGIRKLALGRFRFPTFLQGISTNFRICADAANRLWVYGPVGRFSRYYRFGEKNNRLEEPFLSAGNPVWLIQTRDGRYWYLDGQRTLCCVEHPGGQPRCYLFAQDEKTSFAALFEDRKGDLIFFSDAYQLIRFDSASKIFTRYSFSHLYDSNDPVIVTAVQEDRSGNLWIGTTNGLVRAHPKAGGSDYDFQRISAGCAGENCLSSGRILSLLLDPDDGNILWAGAQHGLNRIEISTGRVRQFTRQTGLPNDVICSMLPGTSFRIWLGTYYGLLEFDTKTYMCRHFTTADGLPANEFNQGAAARLHDGRLLFGCVEGVTVFRPEWVERHPQTPQLHLTELLINNVPVRTGDPDGILQTTIANTRQIILRHDQNNISFCFALLDFFNPAGNRYHYRLEGVDKDWQNNGNDHRIAYANLLPGRYTFWVKAHNSDGMWSEPVGLEIRVLPPWWRSGWAYVLYLLAALSVLLTGLWFWTVQVRLRYRLTLESSETERLKELDHFKTELYANITHELRTPITVIMGLTEQLSKHLEGEWKAKTQIIARNGEKMLRLIRQILDLAKIEDSRLKLDLRQQDVVVFARYLGESYAVSAEKKQIAFELETPPGPVMMDFDSQRLQEILDNLFSNALKFTPEGGRICMALTCPHARMLRVSVSDDGVGIDAGDQDKIFDRYYQVNRQSMGSAGGSGIGLAYCKALVTLMEGTISVSSKPGQGSVFTIELPIRKEAQTGQQFSALSNVESGESGRPEPVTDQQLPQVLVVEDDADMAAYIASCLSGRYSVVIAENGHAGLKIALETIPDLVISDVSMPKMNGLEVCKALKTNSLTSHIPVILLTARFEKEQRIAGLEHGADIYQTKPFVQEELLLQVRNLLKLREALQARLLSYTQTEWMPAGKEVAEDELVRQVLNLIAGQFTDPAFGVPDICRVLSMSEAQVHRKMKALTGHAPGYFIRRYRLENARKYLAEHPALSVAQVAEKSGYADVSYFIRAFSAEFGLPPGKFREINSSG